MNKDNRTGSRLFFIEFLIVLFFFLIVSTVCLRLFARAHMITQRADALSHAQAAAASAAAAVEAAVTDTEISARVDDRADTMAADAQTTVYTDTAAANAQAAVTNADIMAADTQTAVYVATAAANAQAAAPDTNPTDILAAAARYLPGASVSDGVLTIAYDDNYQVCAAGDARYTLTMQAAPAQDGTEIFITVRGSAEEADDEPAAGSQQPVYELTVSFHRPMTREEALQ